MAATTRVLRVITRLNIGGPARQALLLSKELGPEWDTTLVAGTPPKHEGELTDPDVFVQRVPLQRELRPVGDIRAFRALRSLARELRPRIVHTHMAKAGTLGRLAAPKTARTVHTYHGHVLAGYFSRTSARFFAEIERRLAHRTDVLVAISPEVRDELLELGIGEPDRYRLIPLGFDLARHLRVSGPSGELRARLKIASDAPLIGAVGRLTAIKDIPTLVRAVQRVDGAHLALLGDGDQRGSLDHLVRTLSMGHRVHFVGWWTDVASALADLDVVALSSVNEGTPVALIEALAAARPVVATDVGGVRFVVEDEVTGLLAPPGDPAALAAQLERVLGDRELAIRMGAAGRADVGRRFGKERLLRDIRKLYQELA